MTNDKLSKRFGASAEPPTFLDSQTLRLSDSATLRLSSRSIQNAAWLGAGMFAILDYDLSIYKNAGYALRRQKWLLVRRHIAQLVVIENNHIGPTAFFDQTAA